MAAMVISNGQLAGSGACIPTANGLVSLRSEQIARLVNDVLIVASPETRGAVRLFLERGIELPKMVRYELGGLLTGYAPRFAN